jgi:hypothetical protein
MSDSFKGTGRTDVQRTVISAVVTAHHGRTNTDYSTSLITSSTESANTIIAYLSYSTALPRGLYHITATVTMSLSGASTTYSEEYDLQRIEVRDR